MSRELVLYETSPEVLRQPSVEVVEFGSALTGVIEDLTYVMRSIENAVGIAAVQINERLRLGLLELNHGSKKLGKPVVLVNPEVLYQGRFVETVESCLSLPGKFVTKRRPSILKLSYRTQEGRRQEQTFEGLWSRCVMHELDHMNGKLIIDDIIKEQP